MATQTGTLEDFLRNNLASRMMLSEGQDPLLLGGAFTSSPDLVARETARTGQTPEQLAKGFGWAGPGMTAGPGQTSFDASGNVTSPFSDNKDSIGWLPGLLAAGVGLGAATGFGGALGSAAGAGGFGAAEEAAMLGGGLGSSAPIAPGAAAGFSMPPAVPESAQQLADWGLKETSPGNWAMPAEKAASLLPTLTEKLGTTGAQSVLSKLVSGAASTSDITSLLGKLGATALGVLGSNQQANSLQSLAAKYQEYGAPSRARYEASMTPGFDPTSIPGYSGAVDTASKGLLARLSATGGNPYGNPGGLIEANKSIISGTAMPAVQEYQRLNANTGFGSSMNAALGLQTGGITADRGITTALASGLGDITAPDNSLEALYKKMQQTGGYKYDPMTGKSLV